MWYFTIAAPADIEEKEFSTESTSTFLPETTTVIFDSEQNEVDANFNNSDVKTTTMSDIDNKIDSIEADSRERSSERSSAFEENTSTQESVQLMDEFIETTTLDIEEPKLPETEKSIETSSQFEETTDSTNINQASKEIEAEEIQEPTEHKKLERTAMESEEKPESTTIKIETSSTTSEITTEKAIQESSPSNVKNGAESFSLAERTKALVELRKMLRAHALRTVLTLLNEAKKRQKSQAPQQQVLESQIFEDTVPASSFMSECGCDENDEVSTSDEDKVIAFDKNLQRYVYMDKAEYERKNVSFI